MSLAGAHSQRIFTPKKSSFKAKKWQTLLEHDGKSMYNANSTKYPRHGIRKISEK